MIENVWYIIFDEGSDTGSSQAEESSGALRLFPPDMRRGQVLIKQSYDDKCKDKDKDKDRDKDKGLLLFPPDMRRGQVFLLINQS